MNGDRFHTMPLKFSVVRTGYVKIQGMQKDFLSTSSQKTPLAYQSEEDADDIPPITDLKKRYKNIYSKMFIVLVLTKLLLGKKLLFIANEQKCEKSELYNYTNLF